MKNIKKQQIDLKEWKPNDNYKIGLLLPCSKTKPYYKSRTHQYIKKMLKLYLPSYIYEKICILTVSEVFGVVPEDIEKYIEIWYEHYPTNEDIKRTALWIKEFKKKYPNLDLIGYTTSKMFIRIMKEADIKIFPEIDKLGIFEFMKKKNIIQLIKYLKNNYNY